MTKSFLIGLGQTNAQLDNLRQAILVLIDLGQESTVKLDNSVARIEALEARIRATMADGYKGCCLQMAGFCDCNAGLGE